MLDLVLSMLETIGYILLFIGFFALVVCSGAAIFLYFRFGVDKAGSIAGGAILATFCCIFTFALEVARTGDSMKDWPFVQQCLVFMLRTYVEAMVPIAIMSALIRYIANGWRWRRVEAR